MDSPKLTIVIPHLNRTEFLEHAIEDCLKQTDPAVVLVADQGHSYETSALMEKYLENPLVLHVKTDATCLWENWKSGMEAAMRLGARYVSILQDDDAIHARYADRIITAFDTFYDATAWTARLACAQNRDLGIWWSGNGPLVPMNIIKNLPRAIPSELLAPMAYITSWALSPAVAFRCGDTLQDILDDQPQACDLYTERTILASAGTRGPIICDPCILGYWFH